MAGLRRGRQEEEEEDIVFEDDDEPLAQKQRLHQDLPRGAVLLVRMQNFMTYTECTIEPGPRLNLILGPNGTGKSSLVCALCVGLAGGTKLLGRAKDVREYVKRGEKWAVVEIKLSSSNPSKPVTIQRKILNTDSDGPAKSEWRLNGASSTQTQVAEAVAALNIQLDNLCQFLPQDRVVEFARLSPTQLLLETEKALGQHELYDQHQELVDAKASIGDLEKAVAVEATRLERLRQDKGNLERDVERFKQREALIAKAEGMKLKLPWLRYDLARQAFEEAKKALQAAKDNVAAKEKALEQHAGPLKAKEAAVAAATGKSASATQQFKELDGAVIDATESAHSAREEADRARDAVRSAEKRAASAEKRLAKLQRDVEEARSALAQLPKDGGHVAELADLKLRNRTDQDVVQRVAEELEELKERLRVPQQLVDHCTRKLKDMEGVRGQRLSALMSSRSANSSLGGAAAAIDSAREKGRFKDGVYGPLACEVGVRDRDHAAFLEQQCEGYVWSSFVAQNREDWIAMNDVLEKAGQKANVVMFAGATEKTFARPVAPETLAAMGVTTTLDATFDAPDAVKGVLCDLGGLATAYVGSRSSDAHADDILKRVRTLWTPTNQYVNTASRHAQGVSSTRLLPRREARIFTSGAPPPAERAELLAQLEEAKKTIVEINKEGTKKEKEKEEVMKRLAEASRRREIITKEESRLVEDRKRLVKTLKSREAMVEAEKSGDFASEIRKLTRVFEKAARLHVEAVLKSSSLTLALADVMLVRTPPLLAAAELKEQARVLKAELESRNSEARKARETLAAVQTIVAAEKDKAKKLNAEAERVSPLTDARREAFGDLPATIGELEELIESTLTEADSILCPNPSVMQEYSRISSEIAALEKTHSSNAGTLAAKQSKIDATKGSWLPALRALFLRVNSAFGSAFAAIGCAGEVRLSEHGDDFSAYAVDIMVKFRTEEELQKLNANRQSGGERSVSTMLYLISLQDLTSCPFRVVDEINQGMDPKNERKIFKQMVASACAPGTPQCFLLTPKLLPQLEYTAQVTVLAIFNGPWQKEVAKEFEPPLFLGTAGKRKAH